MSYLRGIRMDRGTALAANDANGSFATASEKASMFNDAIKASYAASVFNEAGFVPANKALVFNEAGFSFANKALVFNEAGFSFANKALTFREAGLSIANINAIIIHANITDDNAQQILSEITKANRDLTSADNIYEFLDDWNDNKLTGRDGAGTVSTGFTNLFAQKNLFRPEWTQTGTGFTVSGGKLVLAQTAATDHVVTASTFVTGTWQITYTKTNSNDVWTGWILFGPDITNIYNVGIRTSDTALLLSKRVADGHSDIISGTWTSDSNPHDFKVTRDASGNFEMFEDDVSKGSATDTAHTTSAITGVGYKVYGGYTTQGATWENLVIS